VSQAVITPSFSSSIINYNATISPTINSVTLSVALTDSFSSVRINNIAVTSLVINLPVGVASFTIATIVCTAEDKVTTTTYNVRIQKVPCKILNLNFNYILE
jgi:hypothetical protein